MTLRERWDAFSSRERYLVLAAVAIAVLVVVRSLPSGGEGDDSSAGIEDARWVKLQKTKNYRRIASRADAVADQADAIEKRMEGQKERLISGATPTQVGAELQGLLSGLAGEAGLNVLSSQVLREDEAEGFRRIGVRMTLSGPLGGVAKLLAGIEGGQYDLRVQTLDLTRKLNVRRPTGATAPPDDSPLTVSLEVLTFLREDIS
ncbi:MAG: hypothetical protein ACI8TX_001781 [Hyphomicrobiaceae bacterium]